MVFDILLENKDRHLTADEIFEKLRKSGESVGKTTIYRHLEKLCTSGEVRKFTGGDGDSACYQYAGKKRRMPRALPPQMHRMRQAHTRRMQIFK